MQLNETFWFVAGLLGGMGLALMGARLWGKLCSGTGGRRLILLYGGVAVVVLVAATALYRHLGSPEALTTATPASSPLPHANASAGAAAAAPSSMDSVTANLEARLRQKGGSDADWQLLAQSYQFIGRADAAALAQKHQLPAPDSVVPASVATAGAAAPVAVPPAVRLTAEGEKLLTVAEAARRKRDYPRAIEQYKRLAALGQMSADSWADYADATASLNGNSLVGEPERFLLQALRLDPRHQKALWLQGSVEHETGRYAAAVQTWKRLLALMPPGSSDAKLIAANEKEDALLAGGAPAVPASTAGSAPARPAASGGAVVRGEVVLDKSLASRVRTGMTLYVVAKSVDSPGPPVAVIRTTTGQWPVSFELTDALAMMPGRNLSSAGTITVEARISLSGAANSAAGDLLGSLGPMKAIGSKPLRVVINRVVGQ